jgi:hypothetical protein
MNEQTFKITPEKLKRIAEAIEIDLSDKEAKQCFDYLAYTDGFDIAMEAFVFKLCGCIRDWYRDNIRRDIAS